MKENIVKRIISVIISAIMTSALFSGCNATPESEDKETISVYLWTTALYDKYAPYIQSQLPDVNIQFVVGNNDLDFYKFMNENGKLPDIITCCRFSLHDAAPLKDSLLDLSTTSEAGAVYDTYLQSFKNEDGSVNWLPLCADVHGFVTNKALFEKYNIPLPTDYDSFVYACQEFEKVGIRGYVADYVYDYTCMEVLQGLSIPEITSLEGSIWRSRYEDPLDMEVLGLDDTIWPGVFERMEQFIKDVNLTPDVLQLGYDQAVNMFTSGKSAIISGTTGYVLAFQNQGMDAVLLPYFGQNGEQWLMTTPNFQVSLNRNLENDETRLKKAMRILNVMLSEDAQNVLANGQNVLSYSQNVDMYLSDHLTNLEPIIEQNHMYIRIASNDFFAASKDVVSKMILGEYNAQQAYEAFDAQLKQPKEDTAQTILTVDRDYSNVFHKNGGNESYSVMANTLRTYYGSDVLVAPCNSFTGSVFKAEYSEKMTSNMVMPNALCAWQSEMTGAQVKELIRLFVEGYEGGITPFNLGSLPIVSGISVNVKGNEGKYTLRSVTKDGKEISDDEVFKVTALSKVSYFSSILKNENFEFAEEEEALRPAFTEYIKNGGKLSEPTDYISIQ